MEVPAQVSIGSMSSSSRDEVKRNMETGKFSDVGRYSTYLSYGAPTAGSATKLHR